MIHSMTKKEMVREMLGKEIVVNGLPEKVKGEFMYGHTNAKGQFFESFPERENRRINERLGYNVIEKNKKPLQIPLKAIDFETSFRNSEIFVNLNKYLNAGLEVHVKRGT